MGGQKVALDSQRLRAHNAPMTVAELHITGRVRGRPSKAVDAEFVRELTAADLALLGSERGVKAEPLRTPLRDRHHALARCLASGMSQNEASSVTGYDPSRISILKSDPTFRLLIKHYQEQAGSAFGDFQDLAASVARTALAIVAEKLEETEVTLGQALTVVEKLGDRTGHAPVQRVQQTNINVDLGTRLQAARARLQALPLPAPDE